MRLLTTRARLLCLGVGTTFALATGTMLAPAAQAVVPPLGCKFSTSILKWKNLTTRPGYSSPAISAAADWNVVPPLTLTLVTSGANIAVSDQNFGPTINGQNYDGVTYTTVSGGQYVISCPNGIWAVGVNSAINRYHADSYVTNKRRSVLAHEIGHALGLGHYTAASCPNVPLMHPNTGTRYDICGYYTPQQGDIDGIDAIY